MVLIILLVLALFVLQTLLPACFRYMVGPDAGSKLWLALGPRDNPPPQTTLGGRAERALANTQEALPVFLALALMNLIVGSAALALTGATVFLIARNERLVNMHGFGLRSGIAGDPDPDDAPSGGAP